MEGWGQDDLMAVFTIMRLQKVACVVEIISVAINKEVVNKSNWNFKEMSLSKGWFAPGICHYVVNSKYTFQRRWINMRRKGTQYNIDRIR